MLQEGWVRDPAECAPPLAGWTLFAAAIGTSVDAAAAGVTLPLLGKPLALACAVIGATTAAACFGAVHLGGAVGTRLGRPAEMLGGVVLIALGIRIFVQHHFFGG
jgi:putative Mn2+ efflux pump MntP